MSTIVQQAGPAFATSAPRTATAALAVAPGAGRLVLTCLGGNKNSGPTVTQPTNFTKRGQYLGASVSACLASGSGVNAGAWTWSGQAEGVVGTFETDITGWTAGTPATYPNPADNTDVATITGAYGNAPSDGTVVALLAADSSWEDNGPFRNNGADLVHTGYELVDIFQGAVESTHQAGGSSFVLLKKDVTSGQSMNLTVSWAAGEIDQVALVMCHFAYSTGPSAPTVGAGSDVTGHVATTEFSRTATENDNGATITARSWTIQAGPAGVGTTIGTAAALTWTPTTTGSYTLRYSATNSVGTTPDDMTIQVVAPTRSLTQAWLGIDAITVKTSTNAPADQARVAFSTSSGMTSPVYSTGGLITPDATGISKHTLPSLTVGTAYWYQVELGGALIGTAQAFQSLPGAGAQASFSFGFSSCRDETDSQPNPNPTALADAVTRGVDLFLEIGDFHYRDITANTQSLFRDGYDELFTRSNIAALLKGVPTGYVWDDHDTGGDNTDGSDVALPAAQVVYRERVPSPALPHANGIYHTFRVGRVRFIMLDTRSFRSPVANTDDSSKTMLGTAQKAWLQDLLDTPDSPVTVIASSVGWIGTSADTGQDHWGFYTTERTELGGWITGAPTTQVIFICGDAHMLAIDDGTNAVANTPVYQAAALNQFTSTKGGPYSGGSRASQNAYGYVTVTDTGNQIDFTYLGIYDGSTEWLTHTTTVALAIEGTATANLGGLTATAAGVVSRTEGVATLGALSATATGVRTTTGTAAASLGALTATATGVRATWGTAAAQLGGLTATGAALIVSYLGATGPALNPSVWIVDRDTGALAPLPEWQGLTLSPVVNSPGSCELVIAAGATGFDTLHDNVSASPQRDQEIEVWLAGSAEHRLRWLLQQKAGDDLQPGMLWTFSGVGLEQLLAEALVGPQATETKELIFGGDTYGTILITVVQQAQARAGVLEGVTWDFTTTHDSNGVAWANTITDLKFAPDATLLDVAAAGPEEAIGEFEISPGRVLRAFNFGTRGEDRSTGDTPLRLAAAANLSAAARRESSRAGDAATAALAKGAEGQYQWATDATAEAQRGRRVEVAVDAGQIATSGGVLAAAQGRLETMKTGVAERTHGVAFGPGLPIPGVDYDVADWALSVTGNAATSQRITQWTVTFEPGMRARGTVRTNDLVANRLVKLIRQLNSVQRGGSVVGTSTPAPARDDGKAPAQVTGVAASSSAYQDADGATWAAVTVGWTDVTTNADSTAADDINGYLPQYRYTGGAPMPDGWIDVPRVMTNAADFDGVVAGQAIEVRVAAVDRWGHIGAWSAAYGLTSGADATAPPVPSTPIVESYLGILTTEWNGLGAAGETQPPDFSHVEIHASTSSGFSPHRPLLADGSLDEATSTTYLDRLFGAGTMPSTIGDYGQTWYAKLVAVDRSRNASTASTQDSALLAQAGDGDVSALSVGKLTTGIMSALMTISGIIRTATSGSRVELDTNGIRCYLGSTLVFNFDIPTAALSILGKLTAGAALSSGARLIVDPAFTTPDGATFPTLVAYSEAGTLGPARLNATDQGSGTTALGMNSGPTASGATFEQSTLFLFPQRALLSVNNGDGITVRGGHVDVSNTLALLGFDDGVGDNSFISFLADGQVLIDGTGSSRLLMNSEGTNVTLRADTDNRVTLSTTGSALVSEGVVKSFVIAHPTDPDRWLVHGCTESPVGGVEYWGKAIIEKNEASVMLPPYFEALALEEGRSVFLTPELAEHEGMPMVLNAAPTPIVDGRFRIVCPGPDGSVVNWLVKAARRDASGFEVEPLRSDVEVRGDGPYRYIVP